MKRITISNGGWFDADRATTFEEDRWWDGNNHRSRATGTQWDHEALHLTASGAWVLQSWSQWQGSEETYSQIDAEDAAAWLAKNEHDVEAIAEKHDCPELLEAIAEQEVRPRGRPPKAPGEARSEVLKVRLTPGEREALEARAGGQALSDYVRAELGL